MGIPTWLLLLLPLSSALPAQQQQPWTSQPEKSEDVAGQQSVSIPTIEKWALNPVGDAAVIHTSTNGPNGGLHTDLHLLAINAQFTIPSVYHGPANPDSVYTFLSDDTFLTATPSNGRWALHTSVLNYTSLPPSFPPSIERTDDLGEVTLSGSTKEKVSLSYAEQAGLLVFAVEGAERSGGLTLVKLERGAEGWVLGEEPVYPLDEVKGSKNSALVVEEIATSPTQLAFTAYASARPRESTSNELYTVDLTAKSFRITKVTSADDETQHGRISAPAFGPDGQLGWLQQDADGSPHDQRHLWLYEGGKARKISLDWDLNPNQVIFSKDGSAINLLTPHGTQQSLYHLFLSQLDTTPPATPIRIPSKGTIHDAVHIGITPLHHSHLIGTKSSPTEAKELWVISHSPEDPTDNYENIRLTFFSEPSSY